MGPQLSCFCLLVVLPVPHLSLGLLAVEVGFYNGSRGLLGPKASWSNKRVLYIYTE